MYAEVAWALVSSGTQVQPQIIPDPGYLPDYLSVSYDYGFLYDRKLSEILVLNYLLFNCYFKLFCHMWNLVFLIFVLLYQACLCNNACSKVL